MEAAVSKTLEVRKVLGTFRWRCLRFVEGGALRNIVEAWYMKTFVPGGGDTTGYGQSLELRNPYAAFKSQNPGLPIDKDLDFLLEEIPTESNTRYYTLPLSEADISSLEVSLAPGGDLARLITPYPRLRHDENIALAVLDCRLWLASSDVPVVIGDHVSYGDVRRQGAEPKRSRAGEGLPSPFNVTLHERTAAMYYSTQLGGSKVVRHLTPADLPASMQDSYWGRMARVRSPHRVSKTEDVKEYAASLIEQDEAHSAQVVEWFSSETKAKLEVLSSFIYDCTPEELKEQYPEYSSENEEEDSGIESHPCLRSAM